MSPNHPRRPLFSMNTSRQRHALYFGCGLLLMAFTLEGSAWTDYPGMRRQKDRSPPVVSIISPAAGTTYTTAQTVSITASASDNVGVTRVEFYDGATLKGTDTTSPYSYNWGVTGADNGVHGWTARAYDAMRNSAVSMPVNLNVNITSAPIVTEEWIYDGIRANVDVDPRDPNRVVVARVGTGMSSTDLSGGFSADGMMYMSDLITPVLPYYDRVETWETIDGISYTKLLSPSFSTDPNDPAGLAFIPNDGIRRNCDSYGSPYNAGNGHMEHEKLGVDRYATSPYANYLYSVMNLTYYESNHWQTGEIICALAWSVVTRSKDRGLTWEYRQGLSLDMDQIGNVEVASDGAVYIPGASAYLENPRGYCSSSAIARSAVYRSFDGGETWDMRCVIPSSMPIGGRGGMSRIAADPQDPNILYFLLAIESAPAPPGSILSEAHLWVSKSTDRGATWGPMVKVDDVPFGERRISKYNTYAIDVSSNGRVDVIWYDNQNDPTPETTSPHYDLYDARYSYSLDGGATFAPSIRLSTVTAPYAAWEETNLRETGLVSSGKKAYATYAGWGVGIFKATIVFP